jgi:hypothetical protein
MVAPRKLQKEDHMARVMERTEPSVNAIGQTRQFALAYLRAFVTVLVVAHHAVLAYMPFKLPHSPSFTAKPLYWTGFPVTDHATWPGFLLFVGWNDIFFMALMYFISGLFVWPSLRSHGAAEFLKRRLLRLGVPFIVAAGILAPLAYYPAYLLFGASPRLSAYAQAWLSLGSWPAGPAWFLWVLLVFDCIAALCYVALPRALESVARFLVNTGERPILFYFTLVAVSTAAFLPLVTIFGPMHWTVFGPFFFQTSRALHYLAYFFAGVSAGAFGQQTTLFANSGRLARRWFLWGGLSLLAFAAKAAAFLGGMQLLSAILFTVSCASSSMFVISIFVRFARKSTLLDGFSDNAYGVYLLHYIFVIWLQWALLPIALPALCKGLAVFAGSIVLSYVLSAGLRRSSTVARFI